MDTLEKMDFFEGVGFPFGKNDEKLKGSFHI